MATKLHKPPSDPPNSPNSKMATKISSSLLEKLPDEIILKIFSFLSFKSLGSCNQVSHRIRTIAQDSTLWINVKALLKVIPTGFFEKIVASKVQVISFQKCEVYPVNLDFLREHNLDLKYLDISSCDGNPEFLSELVKLSKSLEYLNLHQSSSSRVVYKCIENMAYQNNLKVLCISKVNLYFKHIKKIIDNCSELTDFSISDASLSNQSIAYICKNLTSNTLRFDISLNEVEDKHIQSLVERCKNLEHLDLSETIVTYTSVTTIVTALSHSLVSLSLPHDVGMEIGLQNDVSMEKLNVIFDLTKLENLHIAYYCYDSDFDMEALGIRSHTEAAEVLAKIFPKLTIGRNRGSSEYKILKTDPCYHFYKPKFKEVTCFPPKVTVPHTGGDKLDRYW